MSGCVSSASAPVAEAGPHIRTGTIKAYAIGTPERSPALPDVPTSKEGGLPEFQALTSFALFAPKGTSPSILDRLTQALDRALNDGSVRQRLVDIGGAVPDKDWRGQQPLAALVKSEIARWTPTSGQPM